MTTKSIHTSSHVHVKFNEETTQRLDNYIFKFHHNKRRVKSSIIEKATVQFLDREGF